MKTLTVLKRAAIPTITMKGVVTMSTSRKSFGNFMMVLLVIGLFLTACQGAEPPATPTPEPPPTIAPTTPPEATPNELLIVRGDEDYPPNEMEVDGKLAGVHIDVVRAVAENLGLKIVFKSVPWDRAVEMAKSGEADAITYISLNPEREAFLHFIDGNILSVGYISIFISKEREGEIEYSGNLEDLKPYRIAILRGYYRGPEFDKATYLETQTVNEMEQLAELVLTKRVDMGVVNQSDFRYFLQNKGWQDKYVFLQPPIFGSYNYIAFSKAKGHGQLAREFSEAMESLKKTAQYHDILKRYGLE